MTNAELNRRLLANVIAFRHVQRERGGLEWWSLPGVDVFSLRAHPRVYYFQQVYFSDTGALAAALPQVREFFRGLGVPMWRVVVLPGNPEAEALLASAGYQADPPVDAMGLELAETPDVPPSIPLVAPQTLEDLVAINAATWDPAWASLLDVWLKPPRVPVHTLVAREAGRPLSCGFTLDVGDTAGVYMVATASEGRGRGLGTEVMRGLLAGARARGMKASVLQATAMAVPMYRRLGYRDLGAWGSWVYRGA
ncbi:GNAT family N-acetyltransferase [Pyxidicoccus sp. 3LG]